MLVMPGSCIPTASRKFGFVDGTRHGELWNTTDYQYNSLHTGILDFYINQVTESLSQYADLGLNLNLTSLASRVDHIDFDCNSTSSRPIKL